jgi:hypothetical protein
LARNEAEEDRLAAKAYPQTVSRFQIVESFKDSFTAQQIGLKRISNQLSSLSARVDSLQNALMPVTTSSIPQVLASG